MFRRLMNWMNGRSTAFAVFFAVNATVLAYLGKLSMTYVSMCTAIHAFVVAHSWKEDKHDEATSDSQLDPHQENHDDNH